MRGLHGYVTPSPDESITWARWRGGVALRVIPASAGAVVADQPSVPVTARDGRVSRVRTGRVLARFPDAAIIAYGGPESHIEWHR